jgi:hypothetical protein
LNFALAMFNKDLIMTRLGKYLAILPFIALSGCLEYNENITVNKNGSGRLQMDIGVLADFIDEAQLKEVKEDFKKAEKDLRAHPEITPT